MDFVCKLYGNTYAVHVTVALVGVATLNLALPAPPSRCCCNKTPPTTERNLEILEISKVIYTKILSCNTPAKLDAILCYQHALVINACMGFIQHVPASFLVNNFAVFLDVPVKNQDFVQSLVAYNKGSPCGKFAVNLSQKKCGFQKE